MKKFLTLLLILNFLLCVEVNAETVEEQKLQQEKKILDAEAEKARQAAQSLELKINSVSEVKRTLDEEAAAATLDYDNKQAALNKTLSEISANEKKLAEVKKDHESRQKIFQKRVRDIYINGQISYIDVLFGAKDFADFLTRMDLLKRILIQDSDLVTSLLEFQTQVEEIGKQLDADKKVQENLTLQAERAKNVKLEKVAAQQEIINRMQTDLEVFNQQYAEKQAASQEIQNLIEEYQRRQAAAQSFVSGSGSMIFPVAGSITDNFGWRTHPIFNRQIFHSGIDIGAEYGEPIHAAQSGTVLSAGWIDGYGNTVMIDHGGGVVSLYGHNQSLAVNVGQSVTQGQVIAYCGSTGNSTGPHCHFEVLVNNEPVDPQTYL